MITEKEVHYLPNWPEQLAELVRTMWRGQDGHCYFPYPSLTTSDWWRDTATKDWANGKMLSRFWVDEHNPEHITATASLVNKGSYWEIGRFNSYSQNPQGVMSQLVSDLYLIAEHAGYRIVCETTQCHTSSQFIVSKLGMRFAGYGFLAKVDGIAWDILYFDNYPAPDFMSDHEGLINDLLGSPRTANQFEKTRLAEVVEILSTEKTSGFPPKRFHIYSKYLPNIESILRMNVPSAIVV